MAAERTSTGPPGDVELKIARSAAACSTADTSDFAKYRTEFRLGSEVHGDAADDM